MENENLLSVLFLRNFVDTIITNISPQQEATPIQQTITPFQQQEIIPQQTITPHQEMQMTGGYLPSITEMNETKLSSLIKQPQVTSMPIHVTRPITTHMMMTPIPLHIPLGIPLGKLSPIFADPCVSSIECPGPGKNVIVHKSGITQTTQIILSQNEIEEILKIVSERTKIPLIKGVFKAAIENLVITAVISEFIGTRFYIEKLRIPNIPHMR